MQNRVPIVFSTTALVMALLGATPLGHAAATEVVQYAKRAGVATKAKRSDYATKAKRADQAKTAKTADQAKTAKTADTADEAKHAKEADEAADAQKLAGHAVSNTPEPGKIVPVAPSGTLPPSAIDLSGYYSKCERDNRFLPAGSRGAALAGTRVEANGAVDTYFNRAGGAPAVSHPSPGRYEITFPGLSISVNTQVVLVTAVDVDDATLISVDSLGGTVLVQTWTPVGNPFDRQFSLVVFDASPAG